MKAREMELKIQELEKKVTILEDLEEIKKLQKAYGYYLEHWMYQEIIDCFSDSSDTELNLVVGIFLGKKGVRRYFNGMKARSTDPEMLHQVMQLSGIVDISTDGQSAYGRWFGFGCIAIPVDKGVRQNLSAGVYTVEYIKENGKWKILKIMWNLEIMATPSTGWVKPGRAVNIPPQEQPGAPRPDKPRNINTLYPSGYIPPFHYRHPVTGKETSERKHNAMLKIKGIE